MDCIRSEKSENRFQTALLESKFSRCAVPVAAVKTTVDKRCMHADSRATTAPSSIPQHFANIKAAKKILFCMHARYPVQIPGPKKRGCTSHARARAAHGTEPTSKPRLAGRDGAHAAAMSPCPLRRCERPRLRRSSVRAPTSWFVVARPLGNL